MLRVNRTRRFVEDFFILAVTDLRLFFAHIYRINLLDIGFQFFLLLKLALG